MRVVEHVLRVVFGFNPAQSREVLAIIDGTGAFNALVRHVNVGPYDKRLKLLPRIASQGNIFSRMRRFYP